MADSPAQLLVTVDGAEHYLTIRDLTALDAKDFRAKVGSSLQDALRDVYGGQGIDLDRVAGLVWLSRRRSEPKLPFESVAYTLGYESEIVVDLAPDQRQNGSGEVGDPEA